MLDAFDLQQHVVGPTHSLGGTVDIVATFSGHRVDNLTVDPAGVISDHSLITCCLPACRRSRPSPTRFVRSWRKVDRSEFAQAVMDSSIGRQPHPSQSVDELFATYDTALRDIADRLACTSTHGPQPRPSAVTMVRHRVPCDPPRLSETGETLPTVQERRRRSTGQRMQQHCGVNMPTLR